MASRAPRVVVVRQTSAPAAFGGGGGGGGGGGIDCCCCHCCTCLNLRFLRSTPGALKLAQFVCGALCEALLLNFGLADGCRLGGSLLSFLTTVSGCTFVVWLLLIAYVCSEQSCRLVRASILETVFNSIAAFFYLSSSSWLAWAVIAKLFPIYKTTVFFEAYPAMTSAYVFGLALGILHCVDAYVAYRHFRASGGCR